MHGPDDDGKVHPDCPECQRNIKELSFENDFHQRLANERAEEIQRLQGVVEFMQELAQDHDCGIAACSIADPRCHNMGARATLERAGIAWQTDEVDA